MRQDSRDEVEFYYLAFNIWNFFFIEIIVVFPSTFVVKQALRSNGL